MRLDQFGGPSQTVPSLRHRDLLLEQRQLNQRFADPCAQHLGFQSLASGRLDGQCCFARRQEGIAPLAQRRQTDTEIVRNCFQILPSQQPQHGVNLLLARRSPAAAEQPVHEFGAAALGRPIVVNPYQPSYTSRTDSVRLRRVPINRAAREGGDCPTEAWSLSAQQRAHAAP